MCLQFVELASRFVVAVVMTGGIKASGDPEYFILRQLPSTSTSTWWFGGRTFPVNLKEILILSDASGYSEADGGGGVGGDAGFLVIYTTCS